MRTTSENAFLRVERLTARNLASVAASLRPPHGIDARMKKRVHRIVREVASVGDRALLAYTERFDGVRLTRDELRVSRAEIEAAVAQVSRAELQALRRAKARIEKVEKRTLHRLVHSLETRSGVRIDASFRPLESVGCYVPGGRAVYPSSVLMNVVPARVAGVRRIVLCSPPGPAKTIHPLVLAAAKLCGVTEIYRVGGAQAIAALAYGTKTIAPVEKIVGPGSAYVAVAKLAVADQVAIDLPAGPSELLIIADDTARASYIAWDLISQAEHGADSIVGLVTTSRRIARDVVSLLSATIDRVERSEVVRAALADHGFVLVCDSIERAVQFANAFAPEHLEIMTRRARALARRITSAGLILIGDHSPVPASDYVVGTNHVLPTGGAARVYSGLSVLDFLRRVHVVECTRAGLRRLITPLEILARAEGLPNHAQAVKERFTA